MTHKIKEHIRVGALGKGNESNRRPSATIPFATPHPFISGEPKLSEK
jgi:hypothetical protein